MTRPIDDATVASVPEAIIIINNTISKSRHNREPQAANTYTPRERPSRPRAQVVQPSPPRPQHSSTLNTDTMCEKHLYTYDSATGVEKFTDRKLCAHAAHGKTCTRTQEYRHPHNETPFPAHSLSRMPPSPPLSEASLHGHSGSDRSYQYINGTRVVVSHKSSHRARRNTLEVPTTTYTVPRTTPPHSPTRPYVVQAAAPPSPTYYDRPSRHYPPSSEVHYEPNVTRLRQRSQSHSRHNADELRRLRRDLEEKEALRQQEKVQSKIDKANQRINSRPPMAPLPAAPPAPQPARYRRGSVSIQTTDMRRVHFDTQEAEDEAQRERLRARWERPHGYGH